MVTRTANDEELKYIYQQVGIVFQHPDNQFVASTVEREIAFGVENRILSSREIRRVVDEEMSPVRVDCFTNRSAPYPCPGVRNVYSLWRIFGP